jgi:hypothetical protein
MVPDVPLVAQANRAFLRRAVRVLVDLGVRQFLDIGSGVPTRGNVHEIAQQAAPESRVVYVDIDPVAVGHSRQVLVGNDRATAIQEDARRPEHILDHPEVQRLLDFARPVAVLLVSVLHFIPDPDDPVGIMGKLRDALGQGCYVVLSHVTSDDYKDGPAGATLDGGRPDIFARPRRVAEVERFFAGFELVEPGLVPVERWRPEPLEKINHNLARLCMHAGMGRKA